MVVVIGAGLVGSVWACLLGRHHDVDVYESRPDPRVVPPHPGRSVHLVISARGWRAFDAIGVRRAVESIAVPLTGRRIHTEDGRLAFTPYGPDNQTIYAVNRATLNELLVTHAAAQPRVRIHFDRRCEAIDPDTGTIRVQRRDRGEAIGASLAASIDGVGAASIDVVADRIFAADGAFSRVRSSLLRLDRFDYAQSYLPYGHKELSIPADRATALERDKMHVWPRRNLMLTAFPNLDGSFGATLLLPFEGSPSFAELRTPDQLTAFFERVFPDAAALIPNLAEEFFSRPTASIVTIQCSPWTYRGRIALLGDAAHAMVPFLGQGMNAGLEDCTVLAGLLERHGDDWDAAFRDYERVRKPQCDAVTELARQHFHELAERVGDPAHRRRRETENKIHKLFPDRFIPLYAMIAFTHIAYATAQAIAAAQDAVVAEVMALPDIESRWGTPDLEQQIARLLDTLPTHPGE
jgi:kynurenine 3-monooxygenase